MAKFLSRNHMVGWMLHFCYKRSGQPQVVGGDAARGGGEGDTGREQKRENIKAGMAYIKAVLATFKDEPASDKCSKFLLLVEEYRAAKRKDYAGLLAKVKELFKGHPHLILWFATLRPKEVEIADILPLEDEQSPWRKKPVDFEKAFGFLHKVKTRFQGADHHVFKAFFDILNSRRVENKSNIEVYGEVAALFEGHRDLVREFAEYAY